MLAGAAVVPVADDTFAVDADWIGPLSSWQPGDEHPVAAGPVKVGEELPRLDVVTVLAVAVLADAVADAETATANPSGSDNSDSAARVLRTMFLLRGISAPH